MNQNSRDHDDLDRRIREALRVDPSAEQVDRLEQFWRQQSRASRYRRIWRATAVAALVLVTASLGLWYVWPRAVGHQHDPEIVVDNTGPERDVVPRGPDEDETPNVPHPDPARLAGRPATAYETLVFMAQRRGTLSAKRAGQGTDIAAVVEQFADEPSVDLIQLLEASGRSAVQTERLLARQLFRADDARKPAVMRLLRVCGTRRSTPALWRLARREPFRGEALATVEAIVGMERLAGQLEQIADARVRAALIERLLTADSDAALDDYLALVQDPAMRDEALAVAAALEAIPLEALLARLDDPRKPARISAAVVLGHVNGPDVSRALIQRVTKHPDGPIEPWIALLACRGETATKFLAFAGTRPKLLAHVNGAQAEWLRLIQ